MFLSSTEQNALRTCFGLLAEDLNERDIRERVGHAALDLFHADHFASFVWNGQSGQFGEAVSLNMSSSNLAHYQAYYQYRDPITFVLQAKRHATLVSEVMPRAELLKTEFFNDFLARDGLHWGMNLHAFDGQDALGDLRIWRARHRKEFDQRDKMLLDMIEPAFVAALRRARGRVVAAPAVSLAAHAAQSAQSVHLSPREMEVARCVCQGLTDKEIARALNISLPSVRTYLGRVFEKMGVHRRGGLAQLLGQVH